MMTLLNQPPLISWDDVMLQPTVWQHLLSRFKNGAFDALKLPQMPDTLLAVGEGSSHHAAVLASQTIQTFLPNQTVRVFKPWMLESLIHTHALQASDEAYCLFLSQSGKTSALLQANAALATYWQHPPQALGMTNATDETVPLRSICSQYFCLEAGDESAIAATKTFSATVIALCLWSLINSQATESAKNQFIAELETTLPIVQRWLETVAKETTILSPLVELLTSSQIPHAGVVLIGRGTNMNVLPEIALKLTETTKQLITFEHSEGFKHGGMAVLNPSLSNQPCLIYCVPVDPHEAAIFYTDATQHLKTFINQPASAYPKRLWVRSENSPSLPENLTLGTGINSVELILPAIAGSLPQKLLLLVSLQALCYATSKALNLTSIGLEKFIENSLKTP
jgi:fructoselysine-6-P-deglycase FrlB-like protein